MEGMHALPAHRNTKGLIREAPCLLRSILYICHTTQAGRRNSDLCDTRINVRLAECGLCGHAFSCCCVLLRRGHRAALCQLRLERG